MSASSQRRGASWAAGIRARMRRGFGDERRELHTTHSRQGVLCVFIILTFGFFWEALAFDLSMSLDMHFESTLYGWWWFMTAWIGAIMVFSLLTMWWRKTLHGESLVQERHFHDLGKLGFAFTAFWGYLTFGQYLVLWYGNMAEETHFFRLRAIGPWAPLTAIIAVLVFVLPFFGLLSRAAKVYLPTFALFAWSQHHRHLVAALRRGLPVAVRHSRAHAAGDSGARPPALLPGRLGDLLLRVHGRVPQGAGVPHDIPVPRRSPGPGRSADYGAAASNGIRGR